MPDTFMLTASHDGQASLFTIKLRISISIILFPVIESREFGNFCRFNFVLSGAVDMFAGEPDMMFGTLQSLFTELSLHPSFLYFHLILYDIDLLVNKCSA